VGQQIPLGARVVAVCDAYDAMISDRPYRQPLSPSEAMVELRRGAGLQFDPRVVDAFCEAQAQADEGTVPPADRDLKRRAA
jgi:HD-GYP domain-containing protein (c-di-GMP phosphodiesterase class II)